MSKAKLAAAKELIAEKNYDEARTILRTINHPTAQNWLVKLDQIDPPISVPPTRSANATVSGVSKEQEAYYARENRKARRRTIGRGIELVLMGIVCLVVFVFSALPYVDLQTGANVIKPGLGWILLPLALVAFVVGVRRIRG